MPSIQDFRNMVGQYSEGYLSMTNDASGHQTLSKVASHRTLTFLNPNEKQVQAQLGGAAAQNIRQALAEALRGESQSILENPTVRKILYGNAEATSKSAFSEKPLSRREVRQVLEVLDLQKLFAKSGVAILKSDLVCVENELYRVKDNCRSAYVKAISRLLPPPVPGKAPKGVLPPGLCARIAERAVELHKAFVGKTDAQITNELLWKVIFNETIPEKTLQNLNKRPATLAAAMADRLDKIFADAVGKNVTYEQSITFPGLALASYVTKGLSLSAALKLMAHPEEITRSDITPGAEALWNGPYVRSETIQRMSVDVPRAEKLTFGVLRQIGNRPASLQEFKIGGKVSEDECKTYCDMLDSELQRIYAEKRLHATDTVCTIPPAQVDTILAFGRQEADNLLVYPGVSGIQDKTVLVKANEDGTMDVLVSCRVCGIDRPGSTAICRVYADGKSKILDLALAQDPGPKVRAFIASGSFQV